MSQNQLGRLTRMDPATISGVIGRLIARGYVRPVDRHQGRAAGDADADAGRQTAVTAMKAVAADVSRSTLEPLTAAEATALLKALAKIG